MAKFNRVFVIVLDSMGIGAMPDSEKFGDVGVDTLGHICDAVEHFQIPNLRKLGLANLKKLSKVAPVEHPLGYYMEVSRVPFKLWKWEKQGILLRIFLGL